MTVSVVLQGSLAFECMKWLALRVRKSPIEYRLLRLRSSVQLQYTLIGETFANPKTREFFWINFRDFTNRRNFVR